ncbi:MAG: hypothetical protein WCA44_18020 [Acidobacteriaceae bacterium]
MMEMQRGRDGKLTPACPRPLSRKKLRLMMPHNRDAFTGSEMYRRFKRAPGAGRFRTALADAKERAEQQEQQKQRLARLGAKASARTERAAAARPGILKRLTTAVMRLGRRGE